MDGKTNRCGVSEWQCLGRYLRVSSRKGRRGKKQRLDFVAGCGREERRKIEKIG